MRITTRLLIGTCLIVGALAAFVTITAETRMRHVFDGALANELARSARLVAAEWHAGAQPASLASRAALALGAHVTIVNREGVPLADSDLRQGAALSTRSLATLPEISIALAAGTGVDERQDSADAPARLHVAVPARDGAVRVDVTVESYAAPFAAASGALYHAPVNAKRIANAAAL